MESREPSAAPSSGGDTIDDQPEDVKPVIAEIEHEDSAAEPPATRGTPSSERSKKTKGSSIRKPKAKKGSHIWVSEGPGEGTEDEGAQTPSSRMKKSGSPDGDGRTQGTAVGTRRQANGTVGSVYSGSKVRHIKKPDGTPLWRREIQYEFLRLVIEDSTAVFTRISDGKKNCTFADIYADCMARSSKTSKVLRERLQVDKQAAQNMAMICLLVNVGRMNTTLNFFPEMRAQLRTYHSIPSLQAYKSQKEYKMLQDAPRLKAILKGASEDTTEPRTLPAVKTAAIPRTNPVNLIFVMSQFAPDVAQLHFTDKVDFFDLAIRSTISSASRAKAFLWLMWWYLEAPSHDRQDALNNPFGPGQFKEGQDPNDPNEIPQLVPPLVTITEEEGDAENEDPEEERIFAEKMTRQRKQIVAQVANNELDAKDIEHKGVKRLKKSARDFEEDSDADSSRASPGYRRSPAVEGVMGLMSDGVTGSVSGQADSVEDEWETIDPHPGRGRYKRIKGKNTPGKTKNAHGEGTASARKGGRMSGLGLEQGTPDAAGRGTPQPLPPGGGNHPIISSFSGRGRHDDGGSQPMKSRARTGYQRQLEEHRNSRIQWLLKKKQRDTLKEARTRREKERWLMQSALRIQDLDATYDSEDDEDGSSVSNLNNSLLNGGVSFLGMNGIGIGGLVARTAIVGARTKQENADPDHPDLDVDSGIAQSIEDDYGEEAEYWLKLLERTKRRLDIWSGQRDLEIYLARKEGRKIPSRSSRHTRPLLEKPDIAADHEPTIIRSTKPSGRSAGAKKSSAARKGGRISTPISTARGRRKREMSLNDEITQDLLAERSEDEDQDQDLEDADGDGDGDDGGDDIDGDVVMEDTLHDDADGDNDAPDDSDIEMD